MDRCLDDLRLLRLAAPGADGVEEEFVGAGAPWFLTLFGRDSLWTARMLLPVSTDLAMSTLRLLAHRQGTRTDDATAEEPGKILHEVRSAGFSLNEDDDDGADRHLPPVYYGTIDATPLWALTLHDAWRWGAPDDEVERLLPALERALAWQVEHGDADGDGLLEYVDRSGHGLSNQGWKDSGDAVRRSDGSRASSPLALAEVQGYAYAAAVHGADLLDAFGRPGADRWREWADRLRREFAQRFWVEDALGAFPAIALDRDKRPVVVADEQHRPPARHRHPRRRRGRRGRAPARRVRHALRLRHPHAVDAGGRLLAHRLPRRLGVAPRHGDLPGRARRRAAPRDRAGGRRAARRPDRLRRPAAGALRR